MSRFREFLYLDDSTVDRLLNDGIASDSIANESSAGQRFRQLWSEISESADETLLQELSSSQETWDAAADLQFCEFTGLLSVPSIVGFISSAGELRNFLQMGQQVGFLPISGNEDEMLRKMEALRDVVRDSFPVVLTTDDSELSLILHIDRACSGVSIDRYRGRATVYGRVIERIAKDEKKDLLEIPGTAHIPEMSRQQRRAAARAGQTQGAASDMTVHGPALVLRVVAIEQ